MHSQLGGPTLVPWKHAAVALGCCFIGMVAGGLTATAVGNYAEVAAQSPARATTADIAVLMHCSWGNEPGEIGRVESESAHGPKLMGVDRLGRIVVVDGVGNARLQLFDPKGRFLHAVPFPQARSITSMAIGEGDSVYLSDGFDVWNVSVDPGEVTKLSAPGGMFSGIFGMSVGRGIQGSKRLLFIARAILSLEGPQPWVVAYDDEMNAWRGIAGGSPVTSALGTLYIISSAASGDTGDVVTINRWQYGGTYGSPAGIVLNLPERLVPNVPARLIGATENPACVYVYGKTAPGATPGKVWKYDAQGRLLGVVDLGDGNALELPGLARGCSFTVDTAGVVYVRWCDPTTGFYVGRVACTAQWGVPAGPTPPPGTNIPPPPPRPGGPPAPV